MSAVRVFTPENRLRHALADSKAPTAAELVAAAERNVAELRPKLRASVERRRQELLKLASGTPEQIYAECEALGAAALGICEVASACGMDAVGEAARGLYAVVGALREGAVWKPDALYAQVGALLLLLNDPPPSDEEARQILDRLKGMRAHLGVSD